MSPDKNVEAVRQKMLERSQVGLSKYGVTTQRTDIDLVGWLEHAQQEAMDFAIYLEAAKTLAADIATLEQENKQMRARMERLESERDAALSALVNSRNALESANEMGDGPIVDTIWYGPAETLFDYMDSAIAAVQP